MSTVIFPREIFLLMVVGIPSCRKSKKKNVISTIFHLDQGLKYYFCHDNVAKKSNLFQILQTVLKYDYNQDFLY